MADKLPASMYGLGNDRLPSDDIPTNIPQVEHQILRFVIHRSLEDLCPILQICPSLFRGSTRERREPREKFEENTAQGPIIHRKGIGLSTKNFRLRFEGSGRLDFRGSIKR
jgi:hypothetical protein